jgi:hypothetical protein
VSTRAPANPAQCPAAASMPLPYSQFRKIAVHYGSLNFNASSLCVSAVAATWQPCQGESLYNGSLLLLVLATVTTGHSIALGLA